MAASLWRASALLTAGLACWLSLTPAPPSAPDLGWLRADLLAHLAMHGGVAFCVVMALGPRAGAMTAFGLAVYLEVAQLSAPGRSFDIADLLANLSGAALGASLARAGLRRLNSNRSPG